MLIDGVFLRECGVVGWLRPFSVEIVSDLDLANASIICSSPLPHAIFSPHDVHCVAPSFLILSFWFLSILLSISSLYRFFYQLLSELKHSDQGIAILKPLCVLLIIKYIRAIIDIVYPILLSL